jgi:orotate phosphoribosyltransferase
VYAIEKSIVKKTPKPEEIYTTIEQKISHNKPFTILRKDGDSSHSLNKLEGWGEFSKYIIIDDFIDTGATVRKIINFVDDAKCVGIFLHSSAILGFESYEYAEYPIKLVGSYLDLDDYSKLLESCDYEKSEFNPATKANRREN